MNYLSTLNEDEIGYICSVIPHQHTIDYFKQNRRVLNCQFWAISISKQIR